MPGIKLLAISAILLGLSSSLVFAQQPQMNFLYLNSREVMRQAQTELRERHYYDGPINGLLTPATQKALRKFQGHEDLRKTQYLDADTAERLGLRAKFTGNQISVSSHEAMVEAQVQLKEEGYYDGPIDGLLTDSTVKALKKFQDHKDLPETGRLDLPTTDALGMSVYTVSHDDMRVFLYNLDSPETIAYTQKELMARKYYDGPIDGTLTEQTREALKRFQSDKNLPATGRLDRTTASRLGLNPAGIPYLEVYQKHYDHD
jgi:peptidoglycan hydrolase-like protein with peptidoglycan-binding domain